MEGLSQMGARIRHKCTEVKTLKNWRPSLTGKNLTVVIVQEESDIQTGGGFTNANVKLTLERAYFADTSLKFRR